MITLKLRNYNTEQKKALLSVFSECSMIINDECDGECDKCGIKIVCDDLERVTRYLNVVCTNEK